MGNFLDKSIITIKGTKLKIFSSAGEETEASLKDSFDTHYKNYKVHIDYLIDFRDKIFFHEEWTNKKLLETDLYYQKQAT